jgi:hypothetical protein
MTFESSIDITRTPLISVYGKTVLDTHFPVAPKMINWYDTPATLDVKEHDPLLMKCRTDELNPIVQPVWKKTLNGVTSIETSANVTMVSTEN